MERGASKGRGERRWKSIKMGYVSALILHNEVIKYCNHVLIKTEN